MKNGLSQIVYHTFCLIILLTLIQCKTNVSNNTLNKAFEDFLSLERDKKPIFRIQEIFTGERFPNVVVAMNGTIICSWGKENVRVRRSENAGETWSSEMHVSTGIQGGGMIVDEANGDVLLFTEERHPISPGHMFRSKDHGKSWTEDELIILPNSLGHIPSMHMNEHGIYLQHREHKGRLIRPSRYYGGGNDKQFWDQHYTNAIYSDDHGQSWHASEPIPVFGTGEACIVELSDGSLYYNTRRHKSTDGLNPRRRYEAWSNDGGQTWSNAKIINNLPDGSQHRDYGLMGGLTKVRDYEGDVLLFSNIVSEDGRKNGTVWMSPDSGKSWTFNKTIDKGTFAYSSMTYGRADTSSEGLVYLFYEGDNNGKIASFNLSWLLSNQE